MNVHASQRAITLPKVEHEMNMHESLTKESMYFHIMTTRALPKHPTPRICKGLLLIHLFTYFCCMLYVQENILRHFLKDYNAF